MHHLEPAFFCAAAKTLIEIVRGTQGYLRRKFPQLVPAVCKMNKVLNEGGAADVVQELSTTSRQLNEQDAAARSDEQELDRIDLAIQSVHVLGTLAEIPSVAAFLRTPAILSDVKEFCEVVRGFLKHSADYFLHGQEQEGELNSDDEHQQSAGGDKNTAVASATTTAFGKSLARRRTFRATLSVAQPVAALKSAGGGTTSSQQSPATSPTGAGAGSVVLAGIMSTTATTAGQQDGVYSAEGKNSNYMDGAAAAGAAAPTLLEAFGGCPSSDGDQNVQEVSAASSQNFKRDPARLAAEFANKSSTKNKQQNHDDQDNISSFSEENDRKNNFGETSDSETTSDSDNSSSAEQLSGLRLQEKLWCVLLRVGSSGTAFLAENRKTFVHLIEYLAQSDILCESALRDPLLLLWEKAAQCNDFELLQLSVPLFSDLLHHGTRTNDPDLLFRLSSCVLEDAVAQLDASTSVELARGICVAILKLREEITGEVSLGALLCDGGADDEKERNTINRSDVVDRKTRFSARLSSSIAIGSRTATRNSKIVAAGTSTATSSKSGRSTRKMDGSGSSANYDVNSCNISNLTLTEQQRKSCGAAVTGPSTTSALPNRESAVPDQHRVGASSYNQDLFIPKDVLRALQSLLIVLSRLQRRFGYAVQQVVCDGLKIMLAAPAPEGSSIGPGPPGQDMRKSASSSTTLPTTRKSNNSSTQASTNSSTKPFPVDLLLIALHRCQTYYWSRETSSLQQERSDEVNSALYNGDSGWMNDSSGRESNKSGTASHPMMPGIYSFSRSSTAANRLTESDLEFSRESTTQLPVPDNKGPFYHPAWFLQIVLEFLESFGPVPENYRAVQESVVKKKSSNHQGVEQDSAHEVVLEQLPDNAGVQQPAMQSPHNPRPLNAASSGAPELQPHFLSPSPILLQLLCAAHCWLLETRMDYIDPMPMNSSGCTAPGGGPAASTSAMEVEGDERGKRDDYYTTSSTSTTIKRESSGDKNGQAGAHFYFQPAGAGRSSNSSKSKREHEQDLELSKAGGARTPRTAEMKKRFLHCCNNSISTVSQLLSQLLAAVVVRAPHVDGGPALDSGELPKSIPGEEDELQQAMNTSIRVFAIENLENTLKLEDHLADTILASVVSALRVLLINNPTRRPIGCGSIIPARPSPDDTNFFPVSPDTDLVIAKLLQHSRTTRRSSSAENFYLPSSAENFNSPSSRSSSAVENFNIPSRSSSAENFYLPSDLTASITAKSPQLL
ncbi:unnamed protein product [Amoebophrya sp. A120]|nr:unnamed protein product [Amoebophrya sp. A120]|eukprot:GSA120T00000855001.1